MRRFRGRPRAARAGVALISSLGVLSLLVMVVAAFLIAMRVEHLAARNARDKARSRHYLQAALTLAAETLALRLVGRVAPAPGWLTEDDHEEPPADAGMQAILGRLAAELLDRTALGDITNGPSLGSFGYRVPAFPTVLTGPATNLIPPGVRESARSVPAGWTYVVATNEVGGAERVVAGRVAFLIVDLGGAMDVHHLTTNQFLAAAQLADGDLFFAHREADRHYAALSELPGNRGLFAEDGGAAVAGPAFAGFLDALGVFSYDPHPDELLVAHDGFGPGDMGTTLLTNRFSLASVTNGLAGGFQRADQAPAAFVAAVSNTLHGVDFSAAEARALFWNLLNYLDADRIPQTDTTHPWLDRYGVEAVPLVNEFVLEKADAAGDLSNRYTFAVELWYPFAPHAAPPDTELQVALHAWTMDADAFAAQAAVSATPPANSRAVGFTNRVATLRHPSPQFHVATAPAPLAFPVVVTNGQGLAETHYLPLGAASFTTHVRDADLVDGAPIWRPVERRVVSGLSFGARVTLDGRPVDEAPGPHISPPPAPAPEPWLLAVTNTLALSVSDPRRNGRVADWTDQPATLGERNAAFDPRRIPGFQGLPWMHRDGLLESIGELGYLSSNIPWQSLDLFDPRAAALLDLWTHRAVDRNAPTWEQGRIHAFTEHAAAARALVADTLFGTNRFDSAADAVRAAPAAVQYPGVLDVFAAVLPAMRTNAIGWLTLDGAVLLPFASWMPGLRQGLAFSWSDTPGEAGAPAFDPDGAYPGYEVPGTDLVEDLIRDLPQRVSFRQNLFVVFLRAQALARSGRVTADSAAATYIVRDAYTGAWRVWRTIPLH